MEAHLHTRIVCGTHAAGFPKWRESPPSTHPDSHSNPKQGENFFSPRYLPEKTGKINVSYIKYDWGSFINPSTLRRILVCQDCLQESNKTKQKHHYDYCFIYVQCFSPISKALRDSSDVKSVRTFEAVIKVLKSCKQGASDQSFRWGLVNLPSYFEWNSLECYSLENLIAVGLIFKVWTWVCGVLDGASGSCRTAVPSHLLLNMHYEKPWYRKDVLSQVQAGVTK